MANPDTALGAFTDTGPWTVDPAALEWLPGLAGVRARLAASLPRLTRRRTLPPGRRVGTTVWHLGGALGLWSLQERRRGGSASIAGISRRLRVAAERLGPTYIKLGQIIASGDGIFPPELVAEFKWCRDQVPAEPWPVVERVLDRGAGPAHRRRCSPSWTAPRWPPPPSPRCTRRRCATGRRWWSRSSAPRSRPASARTSP